MRGENNVIHETNSDVVSVRGNTLAFGETHAIVAGEIFQYSSSFVYATVQSSRNNILVVLLLTSSHFLNFLSNLACVFE